MNSKTTSSSAKKTLKIIAKLAAIVIGLFIVFSLYVSFGSAGNLKKNLLKAFPFPIALVNGQPISAKDFFHRLEISNKLGGKANEQVYNKLIYDTEISQLAKKRNVRLPERELGEEFQKLKKNPSQNQKEPLNTGGLSEQDYKNMIMSPELLKQRLVWWYNSQRGLNPETYVQIDQAMQLLSAGQDFEKVAQKYSQDELTGQLGGNFGFVEVGQLLPELREKMDSAKIGDIQVLPSRLGVQILKVLAKDNNGEKGAARLQISAIVFQTFGFDEWFLQETKNFSIYKLIKNY